MKNYIYGLDVLRGLGIFSLLILHTAFYFYDGIYDVDLNNPTLIITVIGFLLMFAGLFAMISGCVHTIQFEHHQSKSRLKYMLISGGLLLFIAYLYFIFTGPGLIHFETRSMDESLFVSIINQGSFQTITLDRLLYVDSLIMLALNVMLLALFFKITFAYRSHKHMTRVTLMAAVIFLIISYIRIPLYPVYMEARANDQWFLVLLLNFFVNKNNPIFPFYAFGLYGSWIALLYLKKDVKTFKLSIIFVGLIHLIIGILGYIFTPETMLERAIDPTWYFIMVIQIGLFMFLMLGFILHYDLKPVSKPNIISKFIRRFGIAGLTPFFLESVLSALIFFLLSLIFTINLSIPGAILYGAIMAILWGLWLIIWEKKKYIYGIEWLHSRMLKTFGQSTKASKLKGDLDA